MINQLEKGDSLLHGVTSENTRIMDSGFFISLQTEWRSGRFDRPDSPRRHRAQGNYYWWEPPFSLLATVVGKDRDGLDPGGMPEISYLFAISMHIG
ncbi:hypothetical protein C2S52_021201 [Perilla frutescens var. hirtella]|nr:hypothetical protein C2S52_021201 [Perilla frutescens var. hirtella]KAH6808166.1 hypothetical protein C2S51_029274 [Perilla frutescens var. frutescens]